MKGRVEVREFQSIIRNKGNERLKGDDRYVCIEEEPFEQLKTFVMENKGSDENDDDINDLMQLSHKKNVGESITAKNYVGIIELEDGFQIEILPKIYFPDNYSEDDAENDESFDDTKATKEIFLKMLKSVREFSNKTFGSASLRVDRMNLYEIFINMYLQETRRLVKRGIRSSYVETEENLKYYKGKLLVNKHIRENLAHKERFYVSYEEFHPNRPENRLIKSTLLKLNRLTTSLQNKKEIGQLLTAFELVQPSNNYKRDFSKITIDRTMQEYKQLIEWSEVILLNKSFTTFSGSTNAKALLFPMETLFEDYVAKQAKKVFSRDGWTLTAQEHKYSLFKEPRRFKLKPDIVLRRNERKNNKQIVVLDTKWKSLKNDKAHNYGIKQSDMYQMYTYSKKYKAQHIWLLYPLNDAMSQHNEPIKYYAGEGDETTVHVALVDLQNIEACLNNLKGYIHSTLGIEIPDDSQEETSSGIELMSDSNPINDDGYIDPDEWSLNNEGKKELNTLRMLAKFQDSYRNAYGSNYLSGNHFWYRRSANRGTASQQSWYRS